MKTFQDVMRERRKALGLTQSELAEIIGVSKGAVHLWENGRAIPLLYAAQDIADALKISLDTLVGRTEPCLNIGDELWCCTREKSGKTHFDRVTVTEIGRHTVFFSAFDPPEEDFGDFIPLSEVGETFFRTREEAENAAKRGKIAFDEEVISDAAR